MSMTPFRVVEQLDVFKHRMPRIVAAPVPYSPDFLLLQISKKALGHGIVMTVTTATHAGLHIQRLQQLLAATAGVLRTLIGMQHHRCRWLATVRHGQGVQHQVIGDARCHRSTHDVAGKQIHYHRQE